MNRFFYLIRQGLRGVFSHGFRSFASVTIIVACLIIMGSFALLSLNVDGIIKDVERESEILALVEEDYSEEEARSLEEKILAVDNVRSAVFVSRGEAMESYKQQYDDASIFEDIDESVFRDRYKVYLEDITLMEDTKATLEAIPGVADVNAYVELADGFITARNVISAITVILVVILLIVSLFIMSNTIKLATFTRREEIAIMKMVGANNGFIRLPFVVEGLVLGLLGGFIAWLLQWGVYNFIAGRVMETLAGSLFHVIPFSTISLPLLLIYLLVGLLVGMMGGSMAIRNYLKV